MQQLARDKLRALGATIRKERDRLELSQEDFGEKCDLHRTYVGQVERGEKNISFANILRIATALRKEPSELLRLAGM